MPVIDHHLIPVISIELQRHIVDTVKPHKKGVYYHPNISNKSEYFRD
jgi:hypothetical protein